MGSSASAPQRPVGLGRTATLDALRQRELQADAALAHVAQQVEHEYQALAATIPGDPYDVVREARGGTQTMLQRVADARAQLAALHTATQRHADKVQRVVCAPNDSLCRLDPELDSRGRALLAHVQAKEAEIRTLDEKHQQLDAACERFRRDAYAVVFQATDRARQGLAQLDARWAEAQRTWRLARITVDAARTAHHEVWKQ